MSLRSCDFEVEAEDEELEDDELDCVFLRFKLVLGGDVFPASFASTLGLQQVVSKLCVCLQGPTSIDACGKLQQSQAHYSSSL